MKSWNFWKRWIAVGVTVMVFATDQSIIYAAGNVGQLGILGANEGESLPVSEEGEEEIETEVQKEEEQKFDSEDGGNAEEKSVQNSREDADEGLQAPEGDGALQEAGEKEEVQDEQRIEDGDHSEKEEMGEEVSSLTSEENGEMNREEETEEDMTAVQEERVWQPKRVTDIYEKEDCLFEQPLIGRQEEEDAYAYTDSYGNQLQDETEAALYEQLCVWLSAEEMEAVSLGEVHTESVELSGEAYEAFVAAYEMAAQAAWDAFCYDVADAEYLDLENSGLLVNYQGERLEDARVLWSATATWELSWLEEPEDRTEESEESEEANEQGSYQILEELYKQVSARVEQEADTEDDEKENPFAKESYAREIKRFCEQAGIGCVLVKGFVGEKASVWNLVQMEDENWYLIDVLREIFLEGETEGAKKGYQMYGDFSNSQQGMFVYPEISASAYVPENADTSMEIPENTAASEMPEQVEEPDQTTESAYPSQELLPKATVQPDISGVEPVKEQTGAIQEILPETTGQPASETTEQTDHSKSPALSNETNSTTSSEPSTAKPSDDLTTENAAETPAQASDPVSDASDSSTQVLTENYALATDENTETDLTRSVPEKVLEHISVSAVKPQTYTGGAITPKVKVKDISTNKTLKVGKQYTISYENNVNAGTGMIVIRGVPGSGYDGVYRAEFTILPQNIAKKVKAKVAGKGFAYTGLPLTPGVEISYNKTGLQEGVDYRIEYLNNTEKGNAQIQMTGMGNFTGTKVLKFKISAKRMKDTTVMLSSYSDIYGGEGAYPTVTVSYEGGICREGIDYTIKYPKKLKVGKNNIQVVGRGSFTGSVKLTYMIGKSSLEHAEIYFPYAWQYTSKNIKVQPTSVTIDGVSLQPKKDYTIKYQAVGGKTSSSVKKPGDYQIILTGKGNYEGTMMFPFCVTDNQEILGQNYNSAESTIKKEEVPPDTSPSDTLEVEKDKYWGYYEQYKITSKKGIQGVADYTEDLGVQHVLLNVNMAELISTSERSGFIPYTYKGKTYYFGDLIALKNTIYYLHGWGGDENPYGANHMRNVTLVLLMGWSDELSYLIHPSARKSGAAPYYALNMQDAASRDTFEALFRYLGEEFGSLKTRVSNWTLGNEVNSCKEWNYSGNLSLNDCVANYAQAFQLLYKGVKRGAKSSRVFLSLDHCWNASIAGHSGKSYLDQFAAYMNQTAPEMEWNVNYHPYSQPLTKTAFWSDNSNTTSSGNTKYISMKNIEVLTNYLSELESRYGKPQNSIRVIIGELGYTGRQGDPSSEAEQAAALGYGYYIALFNTRIDSYIIRAYLDDPTETKTNLYFGLRDQSHNQKVSYDTYKHLDTKESLTYMTPYLPILGLPNFETTIPGFNPSALSADF